jgi:DNA-binding YbaB/EbfC family protein
MPDLERPDFAALRQRAQRLTDDLRDVQDELLEGTTTGHAADGLVTATVGGDGRLLDLRIDPSVIDPEDPQGLADLVVTAAQHAHRTAIEQRAEHLGQVQSQLNGILDGIRQASRVNRPALNLPRFPVPPTRPAPSGTRPSDTRGA